MDQKIMLDDTNQNEELASKGRITSRQPSNVDFASSIDLKSTYRRVEQPGGFFKKTFGANDKKKQRGLDSFVVRNEAGNLKPQQRQQQSNQNYHKLNRSQLDDPKQSGQPFTATGTSHLTLGGFNTSKMAKETSDLFLPKIRFENSVEQVQEYLDKETSEQFKKTNHFRDKRISKQFQDAFKIRDATQTVQEVNFNKYNPSFMSPKANIDSRLKLEMTLTNRKPFNFDGEQSRNNNRIGSTLHHQFALSPPPINTTMGMHHHKLGTSKGSISSTAYLTKKTATQVQLKQAIHQVRNAKNIQQAKQADNLLKNESSISDQDKEEIEYMNKSQLPLQIDQINRILTHDQSITQLNDEAKSKWLHQQLQGGVKTHQGSYYGQSQVQSQLGPNVKLMVQPPQMSNSQFQSSQYSKQKMFLSSQSPIGSKADLLRSSKGFKKDGKASNHLPFLSNKNMQSVYVNFKTEENASLSQSPRSNVKTELRLQNKQKQGFNQNGPPDVQSDVFDSKLQNRVIDILQDRLSGKKKADLQMRILQNQICAGNRLSPTSSFVSMRCLGYISPAIDKEKMSAKFSSTVHPANQVSKITFDPDFKQIENKRDYFKNVSNFLGDQDPQPFNKTQNFSEEVAHLETLYDGMRKNGVNVKKIDLIEKMVRDKDNNYLETIPPRIVQGFEIDSIDNEQERQDMFMVPPPKQKSGSVKHKLHSNNAKKGWNKSTKVKQVSVDQQEMKSSMRSSVGVGYTIGPMRNEPEYYNTKYVIKRANLQRKMQVKKQYFEIAKRPYLNPENMNKQTLQKYRIKQVDNQFLRDKMIKKASFDRDIIIGILNFENYDQSFMDQKSELIKKIDVLKDEKNKDNELKEYIRYLTGISDFTKSQQQVNQFRSNFLNKLKAIKEISNYFANLFDRYVDEEQNVMKDIAENLRDRIKYMEIYKDANKELVKFEYGNDPKFQWFNICNQSMETVLPVLHYVYRKTLCLKSYTLSIGHAKALAKACELFEQSGINRIIFDNCGIDDDEFSEILKGLNKLKDFKKIIYRHNIFHRQSLQNIQPILEKRFPNHLEELRIENCKISSEMTRSLLELLTQRSFVKKLALVNINLDEHCWDDLMKYLEYSYYLTELDISWASVRPVKMLELLEYLAFNKQIKDINLSNIQLIEKDNKIVAKESLIEPVTPTEKEKKEIEKKEKEEAAKRDKEKQKKFSKRQLDILIKIQEQDVYEPQDDSQTLTDEQEYAISCLVRFIKRNRRLLHINLSNTGLTEAMMWPFGAALRRTKALRSVHLSGNEITPRLVDYLVKRIRANKVKENMIQFNEMPSNIRFKEKIAGASAEKQEAKPERKLNLPTKTNKDATKGGLFGDRKDSQAKMGMDISKILAKSFQQHSAKDADLKMKEATQVQFINRQKRLETIYEEADTTTKQLLITRKLGHKEEMPGSGRWQVYTCRHTGQNDCWICDRHIYSMVFWNERVGNVQLQKYANDDLKFLIDNVQRINAQSDMLIQRQETEDKVMQDKAMPAPIIYGQFTNWQPMKMVDIRQYCEMLNQKNKPDIFELCKKKELIPNYVSSMKDLSEEERKMYEKEVRIYFEGIRMVWKDIVQKHLKYKRPNLVNSNFKQELDDLNYPLYVFPTFMQCGKQYFVVKHKAKNSNRIQWYPNDCIVRYREEDIFDFSRKLNINISERRFTKETSVFKSWKQDDATTIKKCLDHDFRWWKVNKFTKQKTAEDKADIDNVMQVVKDNFERLKALYIQLASRSQFPAISLNDWSLFVKKAELTDKYLLQSRIDQFFISTNFEAENQENNPDKALIRFELIELFLRIAKAKYVETGQEGTLAAAFSRLLDTHIWPLNDHEEWAGFRHHVLYTTEVNDVLHSNSSMIKKVYELYHNLSKKHMTLADAMDLFRDRSECQLMDKEVIYCYGMSKMTVPNENDDADAAKYDKLLFVEFLEMIGRVADLKFRGTELEEMKLEKKIEQILDDIFAVLGKDAKRKLVEVEYEENTESDSDY